MRPRVLPSSQSFPRVISASQSCRNARLCRKAMDALCCSRLSPNGREPQRGRGHSAMVRLYVAMVAASMYFCAVGWLSADCREGGHCAGFMHWSVLPSAYAVQMPRFVSPSCVCSPRHTSRCARIRVVCGHLGSPFWCYAPVIDSGTMLGVLSPLGWCALCSCAGRWWCVQVAGMRLGFPPWQIFC